MTDQQYRILATLCDRGPLSAQEVADVLTQQSLDRAEQAFRSGSTVEWPRSRRYTYDQLNASLVRLRDGGFVRKNERRHWLITDLGARVVAGRRGELE